MLRKGHLPTATNPLPIFCEHLPTLNCMMNNVIYLTKSSPNAYVVALTNSFKPLTNKIEALTIIQR